MSWKNAHWHAAEVLEDWLLQHHALPEGKKWCAYPTLDLKWSRVWIASPKSQCKFLDFNNTDSTRWTSQAKWLIDNFKEYGFGDVWGWPAPPVESRP